VLPKLRQAKRPSDATGPGRGARPPQQLLACQQSTELLAYQQCRYPDTVPSSSDEPDAEGGTRPPHVGISIEGAPIGSLLLQVIRAHARVGTELLNEAGVAPPHEIVLLYLDTHGPVPQTALVHYLGRDRSTVTATLQAMERVGLVTRTSSPSDKRALIVRLSRKGRDAVPRAKAAWHELERRTARALTPKQQADLMDALSAIRDALNNPTK
jgi:MarR family transcriptional regulator, lower aerobic nicotinate degradation pathway regulator